MTTPSRRTTAEEVLDERISQDRKWGEQNHHPERWLAILGEEFGEACEAWLRPDPSQYRKELIQVAAVAIAAIESLDRAKKDLAPDAAQEDRHGSE